MENNTSGNKLLYVAKKSAWKHRFRMILSIVLTAFFALAGVAFVTDPEATGLAVVSFVIALIFLLVIVCTVIEASKSEIRIYEKSITKRHIQRQRNAFCDDARHRRVGRAVFQRQAVQLRQRSYRQDGKRLGYRLHLYQETQRIQRIPSVAHGQQRHEQRYHGNGQLKIRNK